MSQLGHMLHWIHMQNLKNKTPNKYLQDKNKINTMCNGAILFLWKEHAWCYFIVYLHTITPNIWKMNHSLLKFCMGVVPIFTTSIFFKH
jgi:hypothetical protein